MEKDFKINVTPNGNELILRTGEAEKLVPPQKVVAQGTIVAPADWLKDHPQFNTAHAMVILDNKAGTIVYHSNPSSHLGESITGTLLVTKQFNRLKINTGENWSALKLAKHLKEITALATQKVEHMKVIASLEKLKIKVKTELEKVKEESGSAKIDYERIVDTNLVTDLSYTVAIYEGEAPVTVTAKIIVDDVNNGDAILQVISYDLEDEIDATMRTIMKREEARFKELHTVSPQTIIWKA